MKRETMSRNRTNVPRGLWLAWILLLAAAIPFRAEGPRRVPEDKRGREDWLLRQRILPGDKVPYEALGRALALESARRTPRDGAVSWESLGPAPIRNVTMQGDGSMTYSGRALSVAVDPSDPRAILLGAAQGGIWRSEDRGAHFVPVADDMPSQAIKVIRFAPSDPRIVYAGSGEPHSKTSIFGMGVFKSLDGGRTWDALPVTGPGWDFRFLDVSGLQVDPDDPGTVYATTADVLPSRVDPFHPPVTTAPPGIFKSTDGGMTWTCKLVAKDYRMYDYPVYDPYFASGYGFMDLELWRADPRVLFAVERSGGIYRSTDAGEHWQLLTPVKNPGGGEAQGGDFPAPVRRWNYYHGTGFTSYAVLRYPAGTPEFNRIEIGIGQFGGAAGADLSKEVLYAGYGAILRLDADGDGTYDPDRDDRAAVSLLFKSSDGGETWTWLGDWLEGGAPAYCDAAPNGDFENALYDNVVEVNPQDPDDVVVAGNCNYNDLWPDPVSNPTRYLQIPWSGMVYRSIDGGGAWMNITQACDRYVPGSGMVGGLRVYRCASTPSAKTTHPDGHCVFFDPSGARIYETNDGGLWACDIRGDGRDGLSDYDWTPLNEGLSTLQFFNFGPHPTDPDRVLGGMQDNADAFWDGTGWVAWDAIGGDGTIGEYDPMVPRHVYLGCQYTLARHDQEGSASPGGWKLLFSGTLGKADPLPFAVVMAIDPVKSANLYVGSLTGLYRSKNRGNSFGKRLNKAPTDGQVTAISVSPVKRTLVWVGTSTGRVYLFDVAKGKVYDRTGPNLPNRWVSGIAASPGAAGGATVAFSGYDANSLDTVAGGNGNPGKVFRTGDQGISWSDASGNLGGEAGLDVPIASLAVDPANGDQIWIGTDAGVFRTRDGGIHWESIRGNMPMVAVTAIRCNRATGYLNCATFGRGIWRTPLGN